MQGAVIFFDLAFAVMVCFEPYDTPKYVYIQAAIFSTLEACYIASALALIVMHKFSTSHRDLGVALLPFWIANLSIDISFFVGASEKALLSDTPFRVTIAFAVLAQLSGVGLVYLAGNVHLFDLFNSRRSSRYPRDEEYDGDSGDGGSCGSERPHRRRSRRREKDQSSDTEE
ncbi:hypothetical protein JCM3765_000552 [Sporobolomyces pararoseus]